MSKAVADFGLSEKGPVRPTDDASQEDLQEDPNDPVAIAMRGAHADLYNHSLDMTPEEEKAIRRRIDFKIVPYFTLLYLMSFLDRVNIGQARVAGLERDLGLRGNQYDIALTIFFVSYVVVELPSNIALKYLKPHRWIAFIAISWAIVATLMGLVHTYEGLVVSRFFLGIAEGGLFPGLNLVLSTWYSRNDLGVRVGVFFAGATLSGAFGGLLAYGLRQMDGIGGRSGWQWIFIIEGILTFLIALPAYWIIYDFPTDAKARQVFKHDGDLAKWLHRLNLNQGMTSASLPFSWDQVWKGLKDWKCWMYALLYLSIATSFYSLSLFVPSIIVGLGYTSPGIANLLSVPPYVLGFLTTLISTFASDRFSHRGGFIIFWQLIVAVAYAILISPVSVGVKYFAVHLAVAGASPSIALAISWCGNQFGPAATRATILGVFFSAGNSAGLISSNIYPRNTAPRYIKGHAISLAFAVLACVCASILMIAHDRENKKKDALVGKVEKNSVNPLKAGEHAEKVRWGYEHMTTDQILKLGHDHNGFRRFL